MTRLRITLMTLMLTSFIYPQAYALTFPLEENTEVVGEVITFPAKWEDTFAEYAHQYDMGAYQLIRANPEVDEWIPGTDTPITIPAQFILPKETRQGIVINLAQLRLYYLDQQNKQILTFPIGIGKEGWSTPLGKTHVTAKVANPTWYVPKSILAEHEANGDPISPTIPPGPDNPLGAYSLRLDLPAYLIHGTNSSIGVGRAVTHGCIRLFPVDIETLFNRVPVNTSVYIINDPITAGWKDDALYLQAHPPLQETGEFARKAQLVNVLEHALAEKNAEIDWNTVHKVISAQTGIPQVIGKAI